MTREGARRPHDMARVIANMSMSLDGFIADPDDGCNDLFGWYGGGPVELTYLGATAARDATDPTTIVVIDIGGGSTELVVGARGHVDFHVSTQAGVLAFT